MVTARPKTGRVRSLIAICLAFAMVLAACSSDSSDTADGTGTPDPDGMGGVIEGPLGLGLHLVDPVTGGSVRVGMEGIPDGFDPRQNVTSGTAVAIDLLIYDSLLTLDENGQPAPNVATAMESDDNITWTMTLPSGLVFSDGEPFNSQAVVDHLANIAAEDSTNRFAALLSPVTITNPDETTVVFELTAPNATFPYFFTNFETSWIPSPAAVAEHGDSFAQNPVGLGPFMIEGSYTQGNEFTLVRNPNFRLEGKPYLDSATFVPAVDTAARFAALQAGDLDIAVSTTASDFTPGEDSGLRALTIAPVGYTDIAWNLSMPPFDDVRMRRAIIQGIDLQVLTDVVFDGLFPPAVGILPAENPYYVDAGWPQYDPEAAKALVDEYVADGGDPTFLMTVNSPPDYRRSGELIQQMLADIGITVEIEIGEQATMVTEAFSGTYSSQLRRSGINYDVQRSLEDQFRSGSLMNIAFEDNAVIDGLLDELLVTTDPAEIARITALMQEEFAEWLPIVPLTMLPAAFIVGERIGGFPIPTTAYGNSAGIFDLKEVWLIEN